MDETQQDVEEAECRIKGGAIDGLLIGRLHNFEIESRIVLPEQTVDCHQGIADAELGEEVLNLGKCAVELGVEPLDSLTAVLGLLNVGNFPSLNQAEGVPNLVVEVTALFAQCLVKEDVVTCWRAEHHTHAHTVGAKLVDEHQRVGAVAERFRHLAAQLVANDTGEIHIAEWHVAEILITRHNHACHPEENNVGGGNKVAGGIVILDFLIAGVADAVKERNGPQP